MSQENVDIVRSTFENYNRGDFDAAVECLAPDVVWEIGQELPAYGPAAIKSMWERWEDPWEELETVPEEYIDAGDQVVVAVRYSGKGQGSGIEMDDLLFDVYDLRDGRIMRKREFKTRAEALEAAGVGVE